mgnify:CR=1 FL=1|tara:strand:- start:2972 stop:3403 length:432 start_codon:yes stop_codon:yes gene_type:complete
MSIESQAKKIMKDNIVRLSKSYNTSCKDVQLLMQLKEGIPKFYATKDFVVEKELTVKELYPVLVDVFQVRQLLPVFIGNLLVDTAKECDADNWDDVKVYISTNSENADKLYLHAYNKNKPYKQLTWSEVFGEEAMMKLMTKQA